jgi:hypothetical protein
VPIGMSGAPANLTEGKRTLRAMSDPWLHIVGIGEDGLGRPDAGHPRGGRGGRGHRWAATAITAAGSIEAERVAWPHPFDALIETGCAASGRRVVVLATGDPLWFSVGARIGRAIPRPRSPITRSSRPFSSRPRGWAGRWRMSRR